MTRFAVAFTALMTAAGATPARADVLPLISNLPAEYTPGTDFTFEVRAPGLVDFTAYAIELVFRFEVDSHGLLSVDATRGSTPDFAFPFGSFLATSNTSADGLTQRLLITDTGAAANTTANVNDLLALVTVSPSSAFSGSIEVSVDPGSLMFQRNLETTPDIEAPGNIPIINQSNPQGVPAPAAVVSLAIGLGVLGVRRKARA